MEIYAIVQSKELVDTFLVDPYHIYIIYFYELARDHDQALIWKYFDYFYVDNQNFVAPAPYVESFLKEFGYPYLGMVEGRPHSILYKESHLRLLE